VARLTRYDLPEFITFPGGFVIAIKRVTPAEMKTLAGEGQVCDGLWMVDDLTIYIVRGISKKRAAYVALHELVHCCHDLAHALVNKGYGRA